MGILTGLNVFKNEIAGIYGNKAKIVIEGEEATPLYVQFNPEKYSVSESVKYSEKSNSKSKKRVIQHTDCVRTSTKLSFIFDTDSTVLGSVSNPLETVDVTVLTKRFSSLMRIKSDIHEPPEVTFIWGTISIKGVVENVDTEFTMFDSQGIPVRARVDCTILSKEPKSSVKKSPLESPDRTKSRILSEDTNLWEQAYKEYGDPGMWREIARANHIMNPLEIAVGTVLKVPALTDD